MSSERSAYSVTMPPALRMMCASSVLPYCVVRYAHRQKASLGLGPPRLVPECPVRKYGI